MEGADWDLQAVVRGCGGLGGGTGAASRDPFASFPPLQLQDGDGGGAEENDLLFCFPDLLGTETSAQELEQLYKPFFPQCSPPPAPAQLQQQKAVFMPLVGSPTPTSAPCSSSAVSLLNRTSGFAGASTSPQSRQHQQQMSPSTTTTSTRSKRRKNQQKRVICHVPADGLSSDMWAWRKYGQKPIKGSPYPRGYYRCSSSKGCLARKQVERSRADPGVFVITYTAEHNHPVPTHRNSLAGSTRQKFPQTSISSSTPTITATTNTQQVNSSGVETRVSSSSLSPTTPLTSSIEEELVPKIKKEGGGDEAEEDEDDEGMLLVSDMEMLGEDDVLFLGLDEIHQSNSGEHLQSSLSSAQWMADGSTTMAAGGG